MVPCTFAREAQTPKVSRQHVPTLPDRRSNSTAKKPKSEESAPLHPCNPHASTLPGGRIQLQQL